MTRRLSKQIRIFTQSIKKYYHWLSWVLLLGLLLSACYKPLPPFTPPAFTPQVTNTPNSPPTVQPTVPLPPDKTIPTIAPTQPAYSVFLPAYLPEMLRTSITQSPEYRLATTPEDADLIVEVGQSGASPASTWVYALVAPFPTVPDGLTSDELLTAWKGGSISQFDRIPLLMDEGTLQLLSAIWGVPDPSAVRTMPADQLLEYAWANQPSWAIVPFESLDPQWKVMAINGQSPLQKDFDMAAYPLSIPFILTGSTSILPEQLGIPLTNRDSSKLTTVAMTGVTAMVRATAYTMELEGITYPAQDIGSLLAGADITHISNEIPFTPDCPYPEPTMDNLVFCSSPNYIDLLKAVGTDIIELTGDHFMDHGSAATLYTLQMYKDLGWPYYGGGANATEARQPVKLENNGNHIAFMGCNIGCQVKSEIPCNATATDDHPGAAECDFNWINSEIPALRDEGYQVIFTFQHREYYTYTTEPILAQDFGLVAAAGATIVSGSQAHQPHGFAFQDGAFIHYGLGNLFFDQYHYCDDYACDDAFIDRHVFYNGKYISTELITIKFVDFARPRLMTAEERQRFLGIIFSASGW